jgi:PKD repeat protein
MTNEKYAPIVGIVLLALGIVILIFVFYQAFTLVNSPGDYFKEQFPEEEGEEEGPIAQYSWSTNDLSVDFWDESEEGDAAISSWEWNFGDGESSSEPNPQHTFNSDGDYRVRLRVEDQNGKSNSISENVYVSFGNQDGGSAESEYGDFSFGFGDFMTPFAAALLVGILYFVMFLVGGALVKAGWNLLKPGPSTIKMKIKPKRLEVEQAEQTPAYSSYQANARQPGSSQPPPEYYPQEIPSAGQAPAQPSTGYYPQQPYAAPQVPSQATQVNPQQQPPVKGTDKVEPTQEPQSEQKPGEDKVT